MEVPTSGDDARLRLRDTIKENINSSLHNSDSYEHLPEDGPTSETYGNFRVSRSNVSSSGGDTATPVFKQTAYKKQDECVKTAVIGELILFNRPLTMPSGEGTGEGSNQSLSQKSLDDMSALSQESALLPALCPWSEKGKKYCFVIVCLAVIGTICLAGVCGSGLCDRNDYKSLNSSNENSAIANSTNGRGRTTESPSTVAAKQNPPTTTPPSSASPSAMVMSTPKVQSFLTTQELYDAVDQYLKTGRADPIYGHPIRVWNVSQLTNLSRVFDARRNPLACNFNEDLTGWDTSQAETMESLFYDASAFDGDISTWNTGRVTNMREALARATNFTGDLSLWDMSSVTTMFGMRKFFLTLATMTTCGELKIASLTLFRFVVRLVTHFNSDLRHWNVSAVSDMSMAFLNCFSFEGLGLDQWDTSNVQDMGGMFNNAPSFNGDLAYWNVQRVTTMRQLFRQATSFNSDLSRWDVSSVTDMSEIVSINWFGRSSMQVNI